MSNASRIPGKRGRRPALHVSALNLARFADPFRAAIAPPPSGDVSMGITDWQMFGNDQYSDCGPAATAHLEMCQARATTTSYEPGYAIPTDQQVIAGYFAYGQAEGEGQNADQGVTNATWLGYAYAQGWIDAYAEVPLDADSVHRAMLDFGGVLVGVNLTDDAEQLFQQGQPWTTANGEGADPNEGHDIALVAYDPSGDTFVTWGALQRSTMAWDRTCIAEAWVIVTREMADRAGYDFDLLTAELDALHGTGSAPKPPAPAGPPPAPVVPPSPTPRPGPAPSAPPGWGGLIAELRALLDRIAALFD